MPAPVVAGLGAAELIGAGGALLGNIWNAFEARKNRDFQERMSSTSHQRERRDLQLANINPMFRGLGGASTPSGDRAQMEDVGSKGISTALAVRQAKANISLTEAQAMLAQQQRFDLRGDAQEGAGRPAQLRQQLLEMDVDQRTALIPQLLAKAKEEVRLTANSARAAAARAALDELAKEGAMNLEEFEKRIGEAGPWVKLLFQALKGVRR